MVNWRLKITVTGSISFAGNMEEIQEKEECKQQMA
jgi:hypothetical protein